MASFSLVGPPSFPEGTSVAAYPVSNWNGAQITGAPVGSATETKTVTSGVAAFTALASDTRYVAYAQVSSQHRYVRFSTLTDPDAVEGGGAVTVLTEIVDLGSAYEIDVAGNRNVAVEATATEDCTITLAGLTADTWSEVTIAITASGGTWTITLPGGEEVGVPTGETKTVVGYSPDGSTVRFFEVGTGSGGAALMACKAKPNAAQATNTTRTAVVFDGTDEYDTDSIHNPASNNTRVTVPASVAGTAVVVIDSLINLSINSGTRVIELKKNGSSIAFGPGPSSAGSGTESWLSAHWEGLAVANDYFEVFVSSSAAGNINTASYLALRVER